VARWKIPKLNRGLNLYKCRYHQTQRGISDWWFGIFGLFFPSYWEWNVIIPTDFHSMIFQRGRAKKHQADFRFPRLIDLDGTFKQEMASIKVSPGD
jgi:hypothetical protein